MKKSKTISFALTACISFFMLFSAYFSGTHAEAFRDLGFQDFFRIELTVAKMIGAVLLLIPQTPNRVREWIYAGFGICLVSAFIAKLHHGYPTASLIETPMVLVLMVLAIAYMDRLKKASV